MKCHRCGSTMIFKKFCDYGGYSFGWKCTLCGEIIDQIHENPQWLRMVKGRDEGRIRSTNSEKAQEDGIGFE